MTLKKFHPEHNIRRSQMLTPFGIGALFDINNQTVMISDSEYWDMSQCQKINDPRLQSVMHCKGFIEPPISSDDTESTSVFGIRFPTWYLSPTTRKLRRITEWRRMLKRPSKKFDEQPFDPTKMVHEELVPVRFVCACSNGHIQDFPWIEWAHGGAACNYPDLELRRANQTGSIADYFVYCANCHSQKSLGIIFRPSVINSYLDKIGVHCEGKHYWKKDDSSNKKCDRKLQVLLRSANNLYFPNISSSVNIPVKLGGLMDAVMSDDLAKQDYSDIKMRISRDSSDSLKAVLNQGIPHLLIKEIVDRLNANKFKTNEDQLVDEIVCKLSPSDDNPDDDVKVMDYRRAEFNILSGVTKYDNKSDKLKETIFKKETLVNSGLPNVVTNVSLIHQLEVVSALRSFSRLKPTDSDSMKVILQTEGENTESSNEVPLIRGDGYYVGMASRGEGIFMSLDTKKVSSWLTKIKGSSISDRIYNKVNNKGVFEDDKKYITPDYYLLHTLSHILLRELSISSGYSSTALKERLYYSNEPGKEMYGILIYTSSSDSEGTLGGLVKQGAPEKLKWVLSAAIEKAKWCSFDPICIESDGQGSDSLNAGACHACALVSETSCEKRNQFLDRGVLIGTLNNPHLGFFSDME
ncbi:hypothetical protein YK48G_13420 [Lentilactobacillus fungorum]|uniref:MrfA-like Zn-binding domain-containing protein n=1 Tax=Lentilactobacillus fungorum TaxID=2201250 RepID=A0ABQ3W036_9LACO|nr:DUF1998 domain-containing protein [Lentilactobacillus fungorum]GHP13917.1 hypothetical protein YK48G_13420 [Lentilactobacillus fungorum]